MCIRDRRHRPQVHFIRAVEQVHGPAPGPEVGQWRVVGQTHGCLLYTSDAADERSSVDLGGRRIIKKKKNMTSADRGVIHNAINTTDVES